jgi:hypothetical protein
MFARSNRDSRVAASLNFLANKMKGKSPIVFACVIGIIYLIVRYVRDPIIIDPAALRDINFWLIMLAVYGLVGLFLVLVYYVIPFLLMLPFRLGLRLLQWAQGALPAPVVKVYAWIMLAFLYTLMGALLVAAGLMMVFKLGWAVSH